MKKEKTMCCSTTFIPKDFYVQPPPEGADPEVWELWLKMDEAERTKHKRAFTKALNKAQQEQSIPDIYKAPTSAQKINGIWRQSTTAFSGSVDEETVEKILTTEATQDRHHQPRGKRGKAKGNKHKKQRAKRRSSKAHQLVTSIKQVSKAVTKAYNEVKEYGPREINKENDK
jgi:hypothetical protein